MGPGLVLQVPLGREPHTREIGDTGAALPTSPRNATSTSPQDEPVPIPLGKAGAHLLGPPHGARADGHRALPRLVIPVPLAFRRINRVPPGLLRPAEQLRDVFFHHGLDPAPDLLAHEVLQPFPERRDATVGAVPGYITAMPP